MSEPLAPKTSFGQTRTNRYEATHALRYPGLSCGRRSRILDPGRGCRCDARSEQGSRPLESGRASGAGGAAWGDEWRLRAARPGKGVVTDGPFTESKEQLLGFHVIDCADREAAIAAARNLRRANPSAMYEIRPVTLYLPGVPFPVTEAGNR